MGGSGEAAALSGLSMGQVRLLGEVCREEAARAAAAVQEEEAEMAAAHAARLSSKQAAEVQAAKRRAAAAAAAAIRLLTDEAARLLAQLPELTEVNVEFCRKMTDSAARHFSGCPALHTLHVGWAISDLGAQHLARSESIEVLHLSGNALTDAGARPPLPHLRCFTHTHSAVPHNSAVHTRACTVAFRLDSLGTGRANGDTHRDGRVWSHFGVAFPKHVLEGEALGDVGQALS